MSDRLRDGWRCAQCGQIIRVNNGERADTIKHRITSETVLLHKGGCPRNETEHNE